MLHAAGHCISYESVLHVDTSLVNSLLDAYEANEKLVIPANIAHLKLPGYIRFANDNIDINEETLDGKGTFHASQSAIFVRPDTTNDEASMQVEFSRKSRKIPQELQELKQAGIGSQQPEPLFWKDLNINLFKPQEDTRYLAVVRDAVWLICKTLNDQEQHIPAWTGFNQTLDEKSKDVPVTIIGHLPIINAPAHDYDVLWTVMARCMDITRHLGQEFCVLTLDLQLYSKAKLLQWFKMNECENMILMLGGFHTQMNFAKVIGKHMTDSGLKEIWIDSSLFGENTAERILQGKGWNRAIRANKLTLEALWRILWPQFKDWLAEIGKTMNPCIVERAQNIGCGFNTQNKGMIQENMQAMTPLVEELLVNLQEFDKCNSDNLTYLFWRKYMDQAGILLRLTRALRSGDWKLYLASFAEMIPWFHLYDHTNYTRWATIFLADAQQIEERAPPVYEGFLSGGFVVKETHHKFNQLPDDQALEHINKLGKVAGGLVGITRTESARDRWSLIYNERMRIAKSTWTMFGLQPDTDHDDLEWDHKDMGASRKDRDEQDVIRLRDEFKAHNVFKITSAKLINISNGDVATDDIAESLLNAQTKGQELSEAFINDRLLEKKTSYHKTLHKVNSKTFESLYEVSITNEKQKM